MLARDLVHRRVRSCYGDTSLAEAAAMMLEYDIGILPVLESMTGRLWGVITDRDIAMGALTQGLPLDRIPVRHCCSNQVHFCRPEEDIAAVLLKMRMYGARRLPILDSEQQVVGILSLDDIASAALEFDQAEGLELKKDLAETYGAVARQHVKIS